MIASQWEVHGRFRSYGAHQNDIVNEAKQGNGACVIVLMESGKEVEHTRQALPRGCSVHPFEFSQAHALSSCSEHQQSHLLPVLSEKISIS